MSTVASLSSSARKSTKRKTLPIESKLAIVDCLREGASNAKLAKDNWKHLSLIQTKHARFYLLPKIHKPGNSGRPIIASCEAPTENISEFVDHTSIRQLVRTIPSCIKDTTNFLTKVLSLTTCPMTAVADLAL